ncbi:hypothetical protein [Hyalangium versicolor]|uniref:hypothetical protein n=1 Tax=Hyalangium versicolor TaxID=2861190 RepID=UPI001CCBA53A|nr:hypothetical protein [Hyalangium versicolor]
MAYNWKRLEKLNGGKPILYMEPRLDTKDEVWFHAAGNELRVWSDGVLHQPPAKAAKLTAPVSSRFTLYKVLEQLFVDVEVRGDQALLRRGVLNGADIVTPVAPPEVESILARYRSLGFRDGTPWNATKTRVTVREYRKAKTTQWTVRVDGNTVVENSRKETPAPSREAAIALAEKRILAKEKAGFEPVLVELETAHHPNPEPKAPKGAPKKPAIPKKAAIPKPTNAYEAVDAAVAILKDLHTRLPKAHFVAECLDLKTERARIGAVEDDDDDTFFIDQHEQRIGRWKRAKPGAPKKKESSWAYFGRVYGSITWILSGQADDGLSMFYCGNVTGGGWSCLEIDESGTYEMSDLVEATGNEELENLFVFHGGWHTGLSFAFDWRESSPSGEFAIIPFDESIQEMPKPTKRERIEPFGQWLYKRVTSLARIAERNLRELN